MYKISKIVTFDSAHFLRNYEGKCANIHGHTYKLKVTLGRDSLNDLGMVMDFSILKKIIKEFIVDKFDHKILNNEKPFDDINPTAENMSKVFYDTLKEKLKSIDASVKVLKVIVWETPDSYATYTEEV